MDHLLDAVQESERAQVEGELAVTEAWERAEATTSISEEDRALRDAREAAYEAAVATKTAQLAVRDVGILPWHGALRRARSSYLDHSEAWSGWFEDVEADRDLNTRTDIGPTFDAAERAFRRALPPIPLGSAESRIDDIFEE